MLFKILKNYLTGLFIFLILLFMLAEPQTDSCQILFNLSKIGLVIALAISLAVYNKYQKIKKFNYLPVRGLPRWRR